jgi:hypothetical protein
MVQSRHLAPGCRLSRIHDHKYCWSVSQAATSVHGGSRMMYSDINPNSQDAILVCRPVSCAGSADISPRGASSLQTCIHKVLRSYKVRLPALTEDRHSQYLDPPSVTSSSSDIASHLTIVYYSPHTYFSMSNATNTPYQYAKPTRRQLAACHSSGGWR